MRAVTLGPILGVIAAGLSGSIVPLRGALAAPATERLTDAPGPALERGQPLDSDGRWRWARYRAKVAAQVPELSSAERALHADIETWERALSESEGLKYQQAYMQCLYREGYDYTMHVRDEDQRKLDCMRRVVSAGAPIAAAELARILSAPAPPRGTDESTAAQDPNRASIANGGEAQNRLASALGAIKHHAPQMLWGRTRTNVQGVGEGPAWNLFSKAKAGSSAPLRAMPAFGLMPGHR